MSCTHTFDSLRWHPRKHTGVPAVPYVTCAACKTELFPQMSAQDFLDMRAYAFEQETNGKDSKIHRDMFYNPLEIGMIVTYPISYSSSVQLSEAEILTIDFGFPSYGNQDEVRAKLRHGEPWKMKLMPTGRTSRSEHHYWSGRSGSKQRAVTLSSTAGSVVALP